MDFKVFLLKLSKRNNRILNDNVTILGRTTFRYALEKMSKDLKDKMMKL